MDRNRQGDERPGAGDPPVIRDKLALAVKLHQADQWASAERLYREILAFDPGHADTLNLLGVMAHQLGHHEAAVGLIEQAIARRGGEASYHYNLGSAFKSQGKRDAATACFDHALALRPNYAEALNNLGNLRREAGQFDEATAFYTRALAIRPDLAEIHNNLGGIHESRGRYQDAVSSFRHALAVSPDFVAAHCNLGKVLQTLGEQGEAAECYRRALVLKSDCVEAERGLGSVLTRQERYDEAAACYRRALSLQPDFAEAHYGLAVTLDAQGDFPGAIAEYRLALRWSPHYAEAHNNLGVALQAEGQFAEAVSCYERALAGKPRDAEIYNNLGTALQSLGRPEPALVSYRRALAIAPDYAGAQTNLATCLLLMGQLREGFEAFRSRWQVPGSPIRLPDLSQPMWDGESLEGRRILVHCEQGLGDSLQFIRYAGLLVRHAAQILVLAPPALASLFRSIEGIEIIEALPATEAFDCHIPLLCLPRLFRTELPIVPAEIPYLAADPVRIGYWAARLALCPDRVRIGLAWTGAPCMDDRRAHAVDRRRSLVLDRLAPLAGIRGVQFVSLQKGPAAEQALQAPSGFDLLDPTEDLHDFGETAALVANLDLVISVDTSVAHLAGALGKPVWLLSRFDGCWRWLLGRDDSPWYPTMRLFRQPMPGDWDSVIQAVRPALAAHVADLQKQPLAASRPNVL